MWNVLDFSLLLLLFLLRCTPSAGAPSSTQQRRKEQHKRERQARMEKHRLKARSSAPPSFSAQGELARSSQCPGATVPMPCPNLTSAAAPVFVLHVPKAGGRTLTHVGSELTRPILKPCSFSWGNENRGFPRFRRRQRIRYGGTQGVYRHASRATGTDMTFSVFVPPQAEHGPCPVLWYLSGLTCTHANVTEKGEPRIWR